MIQMKKQAKIGRPANNPGLRRGWIGEALRIRRRMAGWSLDELSDALGVSASTVSRWETDHNEPDPTAVKALCTFFDCPSSAFTKKPKLR